MVGSLLIHPDDFFRERGTPGFLLPTGIVLVWSVVWALTGILYQNYLFPVLWEDLATDPEFADLIPNETTADPMIGIEDLPGIWGEPLFWDALSIVSLVIFGFGLWLAIAAVLYLVSSVFSDTGQFGRLLLFVAWGFLPALLYSLVVLGELIYGIWILGPEAYWDAWLLTDYTFPYLSWVVALWVGYIWVYAVKHVRDVTLRQAILTTAVPIGSYLLIELWFWFGW